MVSGDFLLSKNSILRCNHIFTYVFTTVLYWSNSSRNCLWSAEFIRSSPYKSSQSLRKFVPWDPSYYTQTDEWTDMTNLTVAFEIAFLKTEKFYVCWRNCNLILSTFKYNLNFIGPLWSVTVMYRVRKVSDI